MTERRPFWDRPSDHPAITPEMVEAGMEYLDRLGDACELPIPASEETVRTFLAVCLPPGAIVVVPGTRPDRS